MAAFFRSLSSLLDMMPFFGGRPGPRFLGMVGSSPSKSSGVSGLMGVGASGSCSMVSMTSCSGVSSASSGSAMSSAGSESSLSLSSSAASAATSSGLVLRLSGSCELSNSKVISFPPSEYRLLDTPSSSTASSAPVLPCVTPLMIKTKSTSLICRRSPLLSTTFSSL